VAVTASFECSPEASDATAGWAPDCKDGRHYVASLRTTAGTQGYDRVREGFGVQRFMDGSIYEGWFKGDRAHGKGRLIHTDGYIYEGDWFEDKAQGRGIYTN
jgi:hypothetical protein